MAQLRVKFNRTYTDADVHDAIDKAATAPSVRQFLSSHHGIPRSTFYEKLGAFRMHRPLFPPIGRPGTLTLHEELKLKQYITDMSARGFRLSEVGPLCFWMLASSRAFPVARSSSSGTHPGRAQVRAWREGKLLSRGLHGPLMETGLSR